MEFRQFIYTPVTNIDYAEGSSKLRSVYIISENDKHIEGYDISVIDDEDKKNIASIRQELEEALPGEKLNAKYALYFRRFLKSRISLNDLHEIKETTFI